MSIVPKDAWRWFGSPAHFICAQDCRFHMATEVGDVVISTVGEYLPDYQVREHIARSRGITLEGMGDVRLASFMKQIGFQQIGVGRLYETMVFRLSNDLCECGCGARTVARYLELDAGCYNTRGDATRGHHELCAKWAIDQAERLKPSF